MENLGEKIACQRQAKHMTIEELSKRTKISAAVLRDIENGKFDRYKGDEAYVKMYLKKISHVLNMDTEDVTQQYLELTREIQLEELRERDELSQHQDDGVKRRKKFSFDAPQFARKPSVYEDKSHVRVIRVAIVLLLICLVIVVVWFGILTTRTKTKDPTFKPQNQATVEGDVNDDNKPQTDDETPDNDPQSDGLVTFTKNNTLDFDFVLPKDETEFTFKIEFGNKTWCKLYVNDMVYEQFESKTYHNYDGGDKEIVELTFKVEEFEKLRLRVGYSAGHHYYINNQEIPLTDEDISYSATNLKLKLVKE